MKTESHDKPGLCPRCHQPNRCGIEAPEGCWCWHELSGRVKPDPAAESCYCRGCLEALLAEQEEPST